MLALTRNINQSIVINNDVRVTILDVKGKQVKLGIEAPRSIDVHREEIYLKIQAGEDRGI